MYNYDNLGLYFIYIGIRYSNKPHTEYIWSAFFLIGLADFIIFLIGIIGLCINY